MHLRAANDGETASVTLGWRRSVHDDCPSFGKDPSVAHTGPMGPAAFVQPCGEPDRRYGGGTLFQVGPTTCPSATAFAADPSTV